MSKAQVIDDWQCQPTAPALTVGEVHVWRAELDLDPDQLSKLESTLSCDERKRAERFYFPKDQRRFVAARGILRNILSQYLDLRASELSFSYWANGKPALANLSVTDQLRFNVSHSSDLALYAVALHADVGVDVEHVQPALADPRIAESFFTPREVASLRALRHEFQTTAFFNCWTAKEAYLKVSGEGIADGLTSLEIFVSPDGLVCSADNMRAGCSLYTLTPAVQFAGALVVQGPCQRVRLFQWDNVICSENHDSRPGHGFLSDRTAEARHRA